MTYTKLPIYQCHLKSRERKVIRKKIRRQTTLETPKLERKEMRWEAAGSLERRPERRRLMVM